MPIETDRELHRYTISLYDFKKAVECLTEARKYAQNDLAFEALLFMAIVSYCRPFSPNEREPDAKATKRLYVQNLALMDFEQEIHEKCMTLRNKALAHSEWKYNPTSVNHETGLMSGRRFSLYSENIDLDGLVALIQKWIEQCHNMRADYTHRVRSTWRG